MTVFGAVILLFLCLILSVSLNIQDRKEVESDRFSIYVTMPTGSTLENADQVVRVIEERLAGFPEKQDLISRIRETDAELTLVLKEDYRQIGKRSITDIKSDVQTRLRTINGAEISLSEAGSGGGRGGGGSGDMMGGMGSFMRLLGIGENRERACDKSYDLTPMQRVAEDFRYYLDEQEFIRNTRCLLQSPAAGDSSRFRPDPADLLRYLSPEHSFRPHISEPGDFVRDFFQGGGGYLRYHHP